MLAHVHLVFVGLCWAVYVVAFRPSWRRVSIWVYDLAVFFFVAMTWTNIGIIFRSPEGPMVDLRLSIFYEIRSVGMQIVFSLVVASLLRYLCFAREKPSTAAAELK